MYTIGLMAKRAKAQSAVPPEVGAEAAVQPSDSAPAFSVDSGITSRSDSATNSIPKERLSVALNADGSIDLESARGATRDKLRKAGFRLPGEAESTSEPVTTDHCRALYSALAGIEIAAATMLLKCPPQLAAKVFAFDEEEFRALDKPTRKVLDKYAGNMAYKDEIMLAVMFSTLTVRKIIACRLLMAAMEAGQLGSLKPNGVDHPMAQ
jgi:hypothetical protein